MQRGKKTFLPRCGAHFEIGVCALCIFVVFMELSAS